MKKYLLLLLLNISPFFLSCLLYGGGTAVELMFPIIQLSINVLNYKWTRTIYSYIGFNTIMLISSIASIKISTQLYYNNISSDTETLAVGNFAIFIALVLIVLITIVGGVCKIIKNKKLGPRESH